jgi:type III restriction enzyme
LFGRQFDPFLNENWRLLCLDVVANHIIQAFGRKLPELAATEATAPPQITHRLLSDVARIAVRESFSIETPKCIYERLPYPSRNGGFELAFMEEATVDSTVEAFCKVNEQKHLFMRLRYVKENGLPGFYSPDFLVRTEAGIWLTETKAQDQLIQADVIRKKTAAVAWCERLNELPEEQRSGRTWSYSVCWGRRCFTSSAARVRRWKTFCSSRMCGQRRRARRVFSGEAAPSPGVTLYTSS